MLSPGDDSASVAAVSCVSLSPLAPVEPGNTSTKTGFELLENYADNNDQGDSPLDGTVPRARLSKALGLIMPTFGTPSSLSPRTAGRQGRLSGRGMNRQDVEICPSAGLSIPTPWPWWLGKAALMLPQQLPTPSVVGKAAGTTPSSPLPTQIHFPEKRVSSGSRQGQL